MKKHNFRKYNQNQGIFRVINPQDILEPEHPARIVDKVVEMLNLKKLYMSYSNEGNSPYHPKMMLKVLFYSYYKGIMSCRKMWDGLQMRADFIFLSGDQIPDFRTLNAFRLRHIKELPDLFAQIVTLCIKLDMVDFKNLAIDGQKIKACANFNKTMNKERLQKRLIKISRGIEHLLGNEPDEYFSEKKKAKRIERLTKEEEKLEEFAKELEEMIEKNGKESCALNMSDPDAKNMTHKDRRCVPSYNHQSAVDGQLGVTVAIDTKDTGDHSSDLVPLVEQARANTGKEFESVTADSAFNDYEVLEELKSRKEEFYVPDRRIDDTKSDRLNKGVYPLSRFQQQPDGQVICPAGLAMRRQGIEKKEGFYYTVYHGSSCKNCIKKPQCTKGKYRKIKIDSRNHLREEMREKLNSPKGREIYMQRQGIVEPTNGQDQKNRGWIQHHLRSKAKASLEFILIRIGANLGKIITYRPSQMLAMSNG